MNKSNKQGSKNPKQFKPKQKGNKQKPR